MGRHRYAHANGLRFHLVEEGEGPLVLLLHGFPEFSHSWAPQITAVAEAGYRAVAPDLRGYGRSSKPDEVEAYNITALVDDCVGIVGALEERQAVVVGHDWGAMLAWTCAWTRPDVFRAVVGMSVPFAGRGLLPLAGISSLGELKPSEAHREAAGDRVFYQEIWLDGDGLAAEAEPDIYEFFRDQLFSFSASPYPAGFEGPEILNAVIEEVKQGIKTGPAVVDRGAKFRESLISPPAPMPEWLAENVDAYAAEFERTGLEKPLNWYRNLDRDWEELGPFEGKPVTVPAMFVGAALDVATLWGAEAIQRFPQTVPNLVETHIIEGCGHWLTLEAPEETSSAIVRFLSRIDAGDRGAVRQSGGRQS